MTQEVSAHGGRLEIRAIASVPLRGETPKGGWSNEIEPGDAVHAIVAVHTRGGPTGYGSVFTDARLVEAALEVLRPFVIGENALEPERVSEKLHQNTIWMGRGGTLTHAISGIDIALWSILGQCVGMPVGQLLGGVYRDRVQPYCSLLMDEPQAMRESVAHYRALGFRAFKIGWGPFGRRGNIKLDQQIVAAAREAAGADAKLFVDAGASDAFWPNGLKWATRTADMLDELDVDWFEEPLLPDAIDDFIELRRHSRVPIAGGEALTRRQTFWPWLTRGALDIVQPDVTKVGGISEQRKIAWMAREFGVRYIGHGWNTALGLAADMQLAAADPLCDMVEYIGGSPYVDGILKHPFKLEEGYLMIPKGPGLGVELDMGAVARYTPDVSALLP